MMQVPLVQLLAATVIAGILGVSGFLISPLIVTESTAMSLAPASGVVKSGETFTVSIMVTATEPVNAFKGLLTFNPAVLQVAMIDYNVSIADLWAEAPWYENGDGTIGFAGGSTQPGGFIGSGSLLTVTFTTRSVGETTIRLNDIQILKHDGLGTSVALDTSIDALFEVTNSPGTAVRQEQQTPAVRLISTRTSTDLNDDGQQSMTDVSIFMSDLFSGNLRSDFNGDGVVDQKDLSILTTK